MKNEDVIAIYNSLHNTVTYVSDYVIELLENLNINHLYQAVDTKAIDILKNNGVLIDSCINEKGLAMQRDREALEYEIHDSNTIDLTICPTYSCNLHCKYCFERVIGVDMHPIIMSQNIQEQILKVYENHCEQNIGKKQFNLDKIKWYGGEPLLNISIIDYLQSHFNNLALKYGRGIEPSITTNGMLLNERNQNILKKNNIRKLQITIDGPPQIHNKRRVNTGSEEGSFNIILNNLKSLDDFFSVNLRINVDKDNSNTIDNLLNILVDNDIWPRIRNNKIKTDIYLANTQIYENKTIRNAFSPIEFHKLDCIFRRRKVELFNKVQSEKKARLEWLTPTTRKTSCPQAVHDKAFVIGPDGQLFSCWNSIGNNRYSYGNISDLIDGNWKKDKRYKFDHHNFRLKMNCLECKFLPVCSIKCPQSYMYNQLTNEELLCTKWKFILAHIITENYTNSNS